MARGLEDRDHTVSVIDTNPDAFRRLGPAFRGTKVTGVGFDQGMQMANRIHSTGRAVVWSGHKEQAELYWEQLKNYGLTMAPLDRV